jgi:hypothetical protein
MENEMWVCLRCGTDVGDIVTQRDIVEGEEGGGSMWEMGDDESVGLTAVFMENNQVCEFFCTTCFCDIVNDVCTSIYPCGIGQYKANFLTVNISTTSCKGKIVPLRIEEVDY